MLVMASIIYLFVVFLCRIVGEIAFCLFSIPHAYAFGFSGDRRNVILLSSCTTSSELLGRLALFYVVPSHNEGSAKKATGILLSSLSFLSR